MFKKNISAIWILLGALCFVLAFSGIYIKRTSNIVTNDLSTVHDIHLYPPKYHPHYEINFLAQKCVERNDKVDPNYVEGYGDWAKRLCRRAKNFGVKMKDNVASYFS